MTMTEYKCKNCDKVFISLNELVNHLINESKLSTKESIDKCK